MKDLITYFIAVFVLFAAVFGLSIVLGGSSETPVQASKPASVYAEIYPTDNVSEYQLCGIEMPIDHIVLVSPDLGSCGQNITINLVDGTTVSAPIAGILVNAPNKTVQLHYLQTPQVTDVIVQ